MAQEQLKKRYVTLGRWDDLEVFYADSGKWDEFIRVLESNEARATDTPQRIGMLMKIAELWMTQKGKPDRAAKAYEKVLSFDENNLAAAERPARPMLVRQQAAAEDDGGPPFDTGSDEPAPPEEQDAPPPARFAPT